MVELTHWEFAGEDGVWRAAKVPGHIHMDLLRHGLIEDPFVLQNEAKCQWVDEMDWSYRCRFDWQPGETNLRLLRFEGLDTICKIWLNGELLAEHDNMFLPLEVDVSDRLRPGENELRVDFSSAARVGRERRAAYLADQGLPGDVPNFDERAFVRKAQCMFGWDWGPRLVSCGIWKPVKLLETGGNLPNPFDSNVRLQGLIQLVQLPDDFGTTFRFYVGESPAYALGANWIPDHAFPSQVTRDRLRERLSCAKDLGINMLRVWGGGIYESDDFYDLCDDLGILVWQDFMFACSYYPDTPYWQEKIRDEAEYQVKRLRHHPCIAIWCGNNECHQVWEDAWGGKDRQPSRFHGEVLYHEVLKDVVQRLDPERPYVPGSPYGGGYCNSGGQGDQHFWDVWHGRGDWTYYRDSTARFCSEFGFASSPSQATWKRARIDTKVAKEDPDARWHNKTGKPFETFTSLVELHYPKAATLDEWTYYSQLNQRDAMREAIEHFRFSPFCDGALIWQLNDCWPVESWSLLEFDGRKKAAAHELRRLYADLLLKIEITPDGAQLYGCLHNAIKPVTGRATLRALSLQTHKEIQVFQAESEVANSESALLVSSADKPQEPVVWVGEFGGAQALRTDAKPSGIEEPNLQMNVECHVAEVNSNKVLMDVELRDLADLENSFEPNFFHLLPGGRITAKASKPIKNLSARCLKFT